MVRSSELSRSRFGVKRRSAGMTVAMRIAQASAKAMSMPKASRQPANCSTPDGIRRPSSPPTVLPATYSPIALGRSRG